MWHLILSLLIHSLEDFFLCVCVCVGGGGGGGGVALWYQISTTHKIEVRNYKIMVEKEIKLI